MVFWKQLAYQVMYNIKKNIFSGIKYILVLYNLFKLMTHFAKIKDDLIRSKQILEVRTVCSGYNTF